MQFHGKQPSLFQPGEKREPCKALRREVIGSLLHVVKHFETCNKQLLESMCSFHSPEVKWPLSSLFLSQFSHWETTFTPLGWHPSKIYVRKLKILSLTQVCLASHSNLVSKEEGAMSVQAHRRCSVTIGYCYLVPTATDTILCVQVLWLSYNVNGQRGSKMAL